MEVRKSGMKCDEVLERIESLDFPEKSEEQEFNSFFLHVESCPKCKLAFSQFEGLLGRIRDSEPISDDESLALARGLATIKIMEGERPVEESPIPVNFLAPLIRKWVVFFLYPALALLAFLYFLPSTPNPTIIYDHPSGKIYPNFGSLIQAKAEATLSMRGIRLEFMSEGSLIPENYSMNVKSGDIKFFFDKHFMPKNQTPYLIYTPHARIEIVGTNLRITIDASSTKVEVFQGTVRIASIGPSPTKPGESPTLLSQGYTWSSEKVLNLNQLPSVSTGTVDTSPPSVPVEGTPEDLGNQ